MLYRFWHQVFPYYRHDLDPFLIKFNDQIGIRWYSLAYIAGFLMIYGVLFKAVRRRRIPNADYERLEEACLYLIASVIIGGRLGYYVLNQPKQLLTWHGWAELPQVWHGGMAFFGAALAVFVFEYWFCRANRVGFWHGADKIMWVMAFALGFGRLANFINGELYGVPTNGHWGVYFPVAAIDLVNGQNVPRHPVQLYEALTHFVLAFFLLWLLRRKPRTRFERMPGFTLFYFLGGYGVGRFISDFWRQELIWVGPINGGQALSLAMMVVAIILARVRFARVAGHEAALDWYPEEGHDAELPAACHAFIDEVQIERRAEEERRAEARAQRRGKRAR